MKNDDVQSHGWRQRVHPGKLVAGVLIAANFLFAAMPAASAETRTLKLYFLHTRERAEITYKRNGRYIKSGLEQVNHILRDWRRNEPTNMDPKLLDLLWEVYRQSGSRDYIHVVSAYRSPATNSMLRSRSSGVAEKSQHMLGKAVDFFIPDVKLSTLRNIGLKVQAGGVGYYPRSGSPFVHLDVGGVRHWPRMSRKELASVFPDGRTLHVPSDGKPMPGYQQALAAYEARQRSGGSIQVADDSNRNRSRGILARLFGGGADEEEDNAEIAVAQAPAAQRPARAANQPAPARQQQAPQPSAPVAPRPAENSPATIIAELPPRAVPVPRLAPRPDVAVGADQPVQTAQVPVAQQPAPAAEEPQVAAEPVLTALNVPLPTRRPNYTPAEPATQVAEADDSDDVPQAVAYVTPTRRPERAMTSDVIAELLAEQKEATPLTTAAAVPTPDFRPGRDSAAANLAEAAFVTASAAGQTANEDKVAEIAARKAEALAAAVSASESASSNDVQPVQASPRMALLQDNGGISPAALLSAGTTRTTQKGSRLRPDNARRETEPVVVPVESVKAPLVLSPESMLDSKPKTKVPAFSIQLAEAPTAVYTDGFQQNPTSADARRFTGKAVTFLSLAKFDGK